MRKTKTRGMTLVLDTVRTTFAVDGEEGIVVEQFQDGEVVRRVTIDLERNGAEYLLNAIEGLLKRRREHAASLEKGFV